MRESVNLLEISSQSIPLAEQGVPAEMAASRPLDELYRLAPPLSPNSSMHAAGFPMSNDESAAYYDQTRVRTATAEYRTATNRTAVIVGEGALMAALPYIPEDTIVLVDDDEGMCAFMDRYVENLHTEQSPKSWGIKLGLDNAPNGSWEQIVNFRTLAQRSEWELTGYAHPLGDPKLYTHVRELARQKAIIPWHADIKNIHDMSHLGDTLRTLGANVTFMNITNVIPDDENRRSVKRYARALQQLPVTPNAPILATTTNKKADALFHRGIIVEASGPFFGLDNLRNHGGRTRGLRRGSIVERQYAHPSGARIARAQIHAGAITAEIAKTFGTSLLTGGETLIGSPFGTGYREVIIEGPDGSPIGYDDLPDSVQRMIAEILFRNF